MSYRDEIKKRIFDEMEQEVDALFESSDESLQSLHELEKKIVKVGEKAKKRVMEEIIAYQQEQENKKKLSTMRKAAP